MTYHNILCFESIQSSNKYSIFINICILINIKRTNFVLINVPKSIYIFRKYIETVYIMVDQDLIHNQGWNYISKFRKDKNRRYTLKDLKVH